MLEFRIKECERTSTFLESTQPADKRCVIQEKYPEQSWTVCGLELKLRLFFCFVFLRLRSGYVIVRSQTDGVV